MVFPKTLMNLYLRDCARKHKKLNMQCPLKNRPTIENHQAHHPVSFVYGEKNGRKKDKIISDTNQ